MHRTGTSVAVTITAALLLAGCGSGERGHSAPATTTVATSTAPTPSVDTAGLIAACKTAVAAGLDVGAGAPQCTALSRSDYLKALREVDAEAQKAFNDDTNRAASATP
jgi:hypothetical protein